jgi:hypothetical protein
MRQIRTSSTAASQIRRYGTNTTAQHRTHSPKMMVALMRMSGSRREVINLQYEDQSMPIPHPEARSALQGLNNGTVVTPEELVPLGYYPQKCTHTRRHGNHTVVQARQAGGGRQVPHLPGTSRDKPAKEDLAAGDKLE